MIETMGKPDKDLNEVMKHICDDVQKRIDEAYQRGFENGKEVREKGCEGCKWEDKEYNICTTCRNSYKNLYERKDVDGEIKVGDEVRHERGWTAVVTSIDNVGFSVMDYNGEVAGYSDISKFEKTGRHFDIPKILEEMRT